MEEVLLPEWDKFSFSHAVEDPLWSYDVKLGLLDDPFDVECCERFVRDVWIDGKDLRVVVPLYITNSDS
jgi:hypothetical protein